MPPGPTLYNQTTLTDDDFVANFVARHEALDALLRRLRTAEPYGSGSHHLLVGPRGMGKTSLLRRLAIAINREPDLAARYVPLMFREEQYNVLTLGDFWRNCGESLAEWAEATGQRDLADRLDAALPTKAWADDETSVERFNAELSVLKRRAVLLVDNLDLIFDALPRDDHWTLRRHLQADQGPIMIGAATQPLKESADRDAAFYEFFQPHHLEPLGERETERCMRALAQGRGSHGAQVVKVLDMQPERLKTLHNLTGGNPRVLALIYQLLGTAETDAAMADLEILLDQVTPYYKARIEEYQTAQQRAVIDAIALHWDPVTTGDLSRVTNVASTTLSPLLIKLRKDGLIEHVETSGAYAGHQLVERFFNIWYLMRHGTRRTKQKMRWLVGFLTTFYSSSELAEIARHARSEGRATTLHADYALALEEAVAYLGASHPADKRLSMSADEPDIGYPATDDPLFAALGLAKRASEFWVSRDFIRCVAALDEMVARFGDAVEPALRRQVAEALFNKGVALAAGGNATAAIAAYDDVVGRFGGAAESAFRAEVAGALLNKGVTLGQIGANSDAITAYDDVAARFSDAEETDVRERVARALVNKGVALVQAADIAAAITAYDDVVARFGEAEETGLRQQVAVALVNKGAALRQIGESPAAIAASDEVVARFGDAAEPALRGQVAVALFNKGAALWQAGDSVAAIAAYEGALGKRFDLPFQHAALARIGLANVVLDVRGDAARAEALYLEAASIQPLAAKANLSWLYVSAGRVPDAVMTRGSLDALPLYGLALLDAAIDLASDNFGSATNHLAQALGGDLDKGTVDFSDDEHRLLRLAERKGYGERLIAWFEETGFADRLAPFYVAFKAYVRGETILLDVNPEVRGPARIIYDRLDAPRRYQRETMPKATAPAKRGRGRPRKTR